MLLIALLATGLAAQEAATPPGPQGDGQHRGTNFDAPPLPKPKGQTQSQNEQRPPEKSLFDIPDVDWGARETWVKLALLVGSVLLAVRAFNDMTG